MTEDNQAEKERVWGLVREYLKKSLKVDIELSRVDATNPESLGVKVKIKLDGEVIAKSKSVLDPEEEDWF